MTPDLKKEQKASSERPPYRYSLAAKVFFLLMDLITGRTITLPKAKLIVPEGRGLGEGELSGM